MPTGEDRRDELAKFLVGRRQAIRPTEVGLPPGDRRRRSLGLRREEVAILAGVSPSWYTYLEQGRDIRPSTEVLDSLARVLRMSPDERRYLHLLALGQTPAAGADPPPGPDPIEELRQLVAVAGDGPWPVYAANWLCDVVAWNEPATSWYTDWARLPSKRRNMLWWLLNDPLARERVVDWEGETRDLIARFRAVSAWRQTNGRFRAVMRELRTSPEFGKWWEGHEVHGQRTRRRQLLHPSLGLQTFDLSVLYPSGQDEYMIVLHPPAE